jgi:hypothetical protein
MSTIGGWGAIQKIKAPQITENKNNNFDVENCITYRATIKEGLDKPAGPVG